MLFGMVATSKTAHSKVSLQRRRELLRTFRKQYGITLMELGGRAEVSQPMLSQFECGDRDLSAEAWARVLTAMGKLLEEDAAKHNADMAKAREVAAKLGLLADEKDPMRSGPLFGTSAEAPAPGPVQTPTEIASTNRDLDLPAYVLLRIFRRRAGFSLNEVAQHCGLSKAVLKQFEQGQLTAKATQRLGRKISKSLNALYEGSGTDAAQENPAKVISETNTVAEAVVGVHPD